MRTLNTAPRLSVGLPVYNGEKYLAEAVESLLGQSYEDFELIISDNASTDATEDICRSYASQDSRVRYIRQPENIGCAPNHNFLIAHARGELFKWASHDDLYARELLERCVAVLDANPRVVLVHSWSAIIDGSGVVTRAIEYPLATASSSAPDRFKSMLFDRDGDDDYAVIRTEVLRKTAQLGSYYRADRTLVTELALHGPFDHVPDWLYFRRDHPDRAARAFSSVRSWCANLDPRRADRLRHPVARLYGEYVWAFISGIQRAPLTAGDRIACYRYLAQWAGNRAFSQRGDWAGQTVADEVPDIAVHDLVPGQAGKLR